ncbi:hypothetical protein FACS189468_6240 [Spirochaetia bacterium]|nr:hypothetical protein FACS189468_6240 [Spirochaetia bacterium]
MNLLADELNDLLDKTIAGRLLSNLGRRLYFPKGIIAQAGEAKKAAHRANATIGMAYTKGKPLALSSITDRLPALTPEESLVYAPTAGVEELRKAWKDRIIQHNPSLRGKSISLPAVVPGITAGISYAADLFFDQRQTLMVGDPCWDNYGLIFTERRGGELRGIPLFGAGEGTGSEPGLDLAALERGIREAVQKGGPLRLLLNFPNNPSGYTPRAAEAEALIALIRKTAEEGTDVLVICDDAYFGLFYEEAIARESLFAALADLHERVLAIKIDGPTKEDYVWGFRVAFLTVASRGLMEEHYDALGKKLLGAIRSSVSCANTAAQYLTIKALSDPRTDGEKALHYRTLRSRYQAVRRFITENPGHPRLKPLPFNSGYFMCFRCTGIDAEVLRRELLAKHGIGVIALGPDYLRVSYAGVDEEDIPGVYRAIYDTALQPG